jgi:hypothetical protein
VKFLQHYLVLIHSVSIYGLINGNIHIGVLSSDCMLSEYMYETFRGRIIHEFKLRFHLGRDKTCLGDLAGKPVHVPILVTL